MIRYIVVSIVFILILTALVVAGVYFFDRCAFSLSVALDQLARLFIPVALL